MGKVNKHEVEDIPAPKLEIKEVPNKEKGNNNKGWKKYKFTYDFGDNSYKRI